MKSAFVAGLALAGGIAIATPAVVGWAADTAPQAQAPTQPAQAGPNRADSMAQLPFEAPNGPPGRMPPPPPPPMTGQGRIGQGGMGPGSMAQGGMGQGGMGQGGMGHHGWMHQMMQRSPAERCEERLARRAGMIAYTVTKLNLTAEQKPLWDKLNAVSQSASDKEQQFCNSLKQAGQRPPTILDRMSRREQILTIQLQAIQQARPALEAFYQALTPEQKAIIDHPIGH